MSKIISIATNKDVWSYPTYGFTFHEAPSEFPTNGESFVKVTSKIGNYVTWVRLSAVDFIEVDEGSGDE